MSGTTQDGRVWAVQVSDGRKVRVHTSLIAAFPGKFKDLPSARAKVKAAEDARAAEAAKAAEVAKAAEADATATTTTTNTKKKEA